MGTTWVTPSPESSTTPVVRPVAYLQEEGVECLAPSFFFFPFSVWKLYLQTEDSLHGDKEGGNIKGFEEHLGCLLPVLAGIEGSFGEQYRMLRTEGQDRVTRAAGSEVFARREGDSPLLRRSAAALWSKRIARSSPCHSSPSRCRAPLGSAPTAGPGAPGRQAGSKMGRGFIR